MSFPLSGPFFFPATVPTGSRSAIQYKNTGFEFSRPSAPGPRENESKS